MRIGYARISTLDQNLDLQIDALKKAGCDEIKTDKISGVTSERPGLEALKTMARSGDTIVVWRLDRLGRSLRHLVEIVNMFKDNGIGFESLQESINTTTTTGNLVFHIFASLSEFERDLIRARTQAGLAAARARGKMGGRPPKLSDAQLKKMQEMYDSRTLSVVDICKIIGISKVTFYRYVIQDKHRTK